MDTISTTGQHSKLIKPIPSHIQHHLKTQPSSGKTVKEYSKEAGFSAWTFYDWRKRYGNQLKVPAMGKPYRLSKAPMSFTTIGTMNLSENRQPLFDIRFSTGTAVSVYSGISADQLAPFLSLLSGSSASC